MDKPTETEVQQKVKELMRYLESLPDEEIEKELDALQEFLWAKRGVRDI